MENGNEKNNSGNRGTNEILSINETEARFFALTNGDYNYNLEYELSGGGAPSLSNVRGIQISYDDFDGSLAPRILITNFS
jgi:hypothetical protein